MQKFTYILEQISIKKKKNTTIAALLGFYVHLFVTVYSVLFVTDIHKNQVSFQYSIGI